MGRSILHADADAFYASVAQRDDPALRGRPVLVGSWVVMAASYEARAFGVTSGMPTSRALRLCPRAVVATPSFDSYRECSDALFAIFRRFTDAVQPGSMEEAFLDVTACAAPPGEIARELRRVVRAEVGLPLSVGAASTKVLAKIASREAKPDGLVVVDPAGELAFLHALPVERIWGVGPATARRLHGRGIRTVAQAAAVGESELVEVLGRAAGRYVHAIAHNREPRPVARRQGRRSYGAQHALGRRPRPPEEIERAVRDLAERLERRMARKAQAGRTVVLRLRFGDYTRASRSSTAPEPLATADAIATRALGLLAEARDVVDRRGLTMIGLSVTSLAGPPAGEQLRLPIDGGPVEVPPAPSVRAAGGQAVSGAGVAGASGAGGREPRR